MIDRRALIGAGALALGACAAKAGQEASPEIPKGHPLEGLEVRTRPWPGLMPAARRDALKPQVDALVKAMNAGDGAEVARRTATLRGEMGAYLGEPEERPLYGQPVNAARPSLEAVEAAWARAHAARAGRQPWEESPRIIAAGGTPPRLRVTTRIARADLHFYEAGVPTRDAYLARAKAAADYLLTVQAANGVFGYPYSPTGGAGLLSEVARFVDQARAKGAEVTANGWLIDDLQTGALNFDNAQAGLFLLHAHLLTGDGRYLAAAERAGDWAAPRGLVGNYNYNGFNGQLLARLYRVTGDARRLARAREIFELGVLSGQLQTGRWLDQHNAKIQYHAILMSQLLEFHLALTLAKDPYAATVRQAIERGLDNLAAEIVTYGSSNTHELLAVDALAVASLSLGPREAWTRAMNVDINFLMDHFAAKLRARGAGPPEPVGLYVLFRRGPAAGASEIDFRPAPARP